MIVNGKPYITDEETIREMDRAEEARRLQEACEYFVAAERHFQKLDARSDKASNPKVNVCWWTALEEVYQREKDAQRIFVGQPATLEGNKLWARFRTMLLAGGKLVPNA
jgi:hypothetical protein